MNSISFDSISDSRHRTKHELSKIAAWQGKLDEAYELAKEGLELVSVGKPNHASVMAAQYRLGWIAMLLEKFDLSLEHLQRALVIAQLNEQQRGNSGESARVRWHGSGGEFLKFMGRLGGSKMRRLSMTVLYVLKRIYWQVESTPHRKMRKAAGIL